MPTLLTSISKEYKHRRSHEKSRKGCLRCKKQRKKCDEVLPVCTRCKKRNHECQYTFQDDRFRPKSKHVSPDPDLLVPEIPGLGYLSLIEASPKSFEARSDDACSSVSGFTTTSPYPAPGVPEGPRASHALNSEQLELLSHYITHTSRVIPYNTEDLYALHVGIPNLAFGSRPVMDSILALSAVCKAYDILKHSPAPLERLEEIHRLLSLADQHHRTSLHQLQTTIYDDLCDTVLANGALMVLYALSDHCVRVLLARKAKRAGEILSNDLLPMQSQWITSIRAASVAYIGLSNSACDDMGDELLSPASIAEQDCPSYSTSLPGDDIYFPEDGPSEETKRLLLPIVSATYRAALEKLDARAQVICIEESDLITHDQTSHNPDLQNCLATLKLLEDSFAKVFSVCQSRPEPSQASYTTPGLSQFGKLDKASPWLRNYMASATSARPSKLLRRIIMSFLNKVPFEYLQLVQSALDYMPVAAKQSDPNSPEQIVPLSAAQRLAMNIFAHWLVLVMLLDGVWWIGGIGQWELGRILSFADSQGWALGSTETDGTWWPESMFAVQKAIAERME
ncbi:hypothetical protein ACQKWADRAFT_321312 [Trichoderma austrokoningii]